MTAMNDTSPARVAVHEAGHAVMDVLFNHAFAFVTIEAAGDKLGAVHRDEDQPRPEPWNVHRVYELIIVLLAGQLAELRSVGDDSYTLSFSSNPSDDLARVRARLAPFGVLTDQMIEVFVVATGNLVERPTIACAVERVRDALLARTTITQADVKILVEDLLTDEDRRMAETWLALIDDEVVAVIDRHNALLREKIESAQGMNQ